MLGKWRSHNMHRQFVLYSLNMYNDPSPIREYLNIILKLFILNLDNLKNVISHRYSNTGRAATRQPELFRILVLMLHLKLTPIKCIEKLKQNHVLRIACGLTLKKIPSVASLYNFIYRIVGRRDQPATKKYKRKPKYKLAKGEKIPLNRPHVTKRLKEKLIIGRRFTDPVATAINEILSIVIKQSYEVGLMAPDINISGDGTCIPTGASPYGKKKCGCKDNGVYDCDCPRTFSDPNASWGWDSHNSCAFYGYTGYFISTYDAANKVDLPLYLRIVDARRHDSVSALVALSEFIDSYPQLRVKTFLSDSASDNYPTYELLDFWNIDAVIALGRTNNDNFKYKTPLQIEADGTPICPSGHKMICMGECGGNRTRIKWRCPRVLGKLDDGAPCIKCSPSSYGRTFYTKPEWDLRIFCKIPRGTDQWKNLMKERTAAERVNDRILNDYGVGKSGRRGKGRVSFFTMIAAVNIHLDAQLKVIMADKLGITA